MNEPEYGRLIRIGRLTFHFSSLHLLFGMISLAFVGQVMLAGGLDSGGSIFEFGGISNGGCWAPGGCGPRAVFQNHEWWRLFTAMFLHVGVVHLLMNAWAFYSLGKLADRIYGPGRLLFIYLLCGLVSSLASAVWRHLRVEVFEWDLVTGYSLGASGAIAGLMGALLINMRTHVDIQSQMAYRGLFRWAILLLGFGFVYPNIDQAGHVGGFAAGVVLAKVLQEGHFDQLRRGREQRVVFAGTALLVVLTLASIGIAVAGAAERHGRYGEIQTLWEHLDTALDRAPKSTKTETRLRLQRGLRRLDLSYPDLQAIRDGAASLFTDHPGPLRLVQGLLQAKADLNELGFRLVPDRYSLRRR
ncbi:MAG: hypothetical protein CMJ18_26795 [Phycisphaeraceae bacterium]|nr:hypothetical protein [Phycisphaeraceae bacterium]